MTETAGTTTPADKLYAGKFKSVEELENGYKSSATVFDENEKLKAKVTELSSVPHDYQNPSDIEMDENRIADIKARAKEAGMTQTQYEKFLRSDKARLDQQKQNFENAKKEVGEATENMLKDYVAKHYPPEMQESMLNTFIGNKDMRAAALKHRETLLNTTIPGVSKPAGGGYNVTNEDIRKAYIAKEKNPGSMEARQHYLNLVAQKAANKGA
jgi:hypothetical protein